MGKIWGDYPFNRRLGGFLRISLIKPTVKNREERHWLLQGDPDGKAIVKHADTMFRQGQILLKG